MSSQSSGVVLLHLRRLDRFLKRQGLHKIAHTLERESLAYLDTAHLRKLVKIGDWDGTWAYLRPFSPLWEEVGKGEQFAAFLHTLQHHGTLHYLACRGGRNASELFWWSSSDDFCSKFPQLAKRHDFAEVVQRHEQYRSMASEQVRASLDWEAMKLTTLEKLEELLHLCPDLERSFRMREPRHIPKPSEITPLTFGLRGSRRQQRKRVDQKPAARELALFLLRKRPPSSQEINHSSESGVSSATLLQPKEAENACDVSSSPASTELPWTCRKRLRCQDDYCTGNAQQDFGPTDCFKRPRIPEDVGEMVLLE